MRNAVLCNLLQCCSLLKRFYAAVNIIMRKICKLLLDREGEWENSFTITSNLKFQEVLSGRFEKDPDEK